MIEQLDILVGHFLAVHVFDFIAEHAAVKTYEVRFRQLADECCNILLLDVGVSVVLASCSRILCVAIVDEEVEFVFYFTIFVMTLAVKDIRLGDVIITLGHKSVFHLILNLFNRNSVVDADTAHDVGENLLRSEATDAEEGFLNCIFDFIDRERLALTISLDNKDLVELHATSFCILLMLVLLVNIDRLKNVNF